MTQPNDPLPVRLFGPDGAVLTGADFTATGMYGPGEPLVPFQTEPNPTPWEYQYAQGFNLVPTPRSEDPRTIRFAQLERAASAPYAAQAINFLQKQVKATGWKTVPRDQTSTKAMDHFKDQIKTVDDFFRTPNQIDNLRFAEWVGQIVIDILTYDAAVLFKWPTRDGEGLHSLVSVSPPTVKLVIDATGHVVGYQQILFGYPWAYYPAFTNKSSLSDVRDGEMVYKMMNPQTDSVYGSPPSEPILGTLLLAEKRLQNQIAWYTDGNIPTAYMECPEGWGVNEIAKGQSYFNARAGDAAQRQKLFLVPHGANMKPMKPFQYDKDEEESIISAICAQYGTPRHIFVSQVNRSVAETAHDEALDAGYKPLIIFLADFMNEIIADDFGFPELQRIPIEKPAGTELERAYARQIDIQSGIITRNEGREERGLSPNDDPAPPPPEPKATKQPGVAEKPSDPEDRNQRKYRPTESGTSPSEILKELGEWDRFSGKRLSKGRQADEFKTKSIPEPIAEMIRASLPTMRDSEMLKTLFKMAKSAVSAAAKLPKPIETIIRTNLHGTDKSVVDAIVSDADDKWGASLAKKDDATEGEWDSVELSDRELALLGQLEAEANGVLAQQGRRALKNVRESFVNG